ncbi:MAG: HIT domain-containing protein [Thermodesulfovibrionales bacterium]|nr:HIT domain-containing protein [Thermodesulfovibrionales bacterium]
MKVLWAPWRMEYILAKKPEGCIFCDMPSENNDPKNFILKRAVYCYVIMNKYPYNNGHLMIVPFRHVPDLNGLEKHEMLEIMELTRLSINCLREAFLPDGFNIGINLGRIAGAGIEAHLHIQIVPRWAGDSSFMAVFDETRVIPEHLEATYKKLLPLFEKCTL